MRCIYEYGTLNPLAIMSVITASKTVIASLNWILLVLIRLYQLYSRQSRCCKKDTFENPSSSQLFGCVCSCL
jgi:hypothetical protein